MPIQYKRGSLILLDQTLLPQEFKWIPILSIESAWKAIHFMSVRGAPAIAISAVLALAVWLENGRASFVEKPIHELALLIKEHTDYLRTSRPTAVNLFNAIDDIQSKCDNMVKEQKQTEELLEYVIVYAESLFANDLTNNKKMGQYGAIRLAAGAQKPKINVLTHCNTGSLATAGYGTAIGVIRALHERGELEHCYCTETRPYNQGSRLTALELVCAGIPATLITDSMAGALMAQKKVDAIVVGADRIVANGDTANKIGTYSLAVLAQYHGVKFYVAAPIETLDTEKKSGDEIEIEQRSAREVTHFKDIQIAPLEIGVWNPSFDVTPATLIEALITDKGIIEKVNDTFAISSFLQQ